MIIAGTGHRPEDCEAESIVRTKAGTALRYSGADVFICGMAAGFDLWAGDEALRLGLDVWAAKPWTGHKWRKGDEQLYARIIEGASRVVNVVEQENYPGVWVYHNRDKWMVDNCTHILAYLSPGAAAAKKGGTYGTVEYARGKKPIRNIYEAAPF